MFVSVFSLLVYGIYNKNALNSEHLFVFLSHPYEFNLGHGPSHCFGVLLGPLGLSPTLDLSQARHKSYSNMSFPVKLYNTHKACSKTFNAKCVSVCKY